LAHADFEQWLFIILGIVTALWGVVLFFALPDTPKTAWFLKPEQRLAADQRPQESQRSFKTNQWSQAQFNEAMRDLKTWFLFIIITMSSLTNGVISNVSESYVHASHDANSY
jgi:ACS family allantoate permease-like MFS transporter